MTKNSDPSDGGSRSQTNKALKLRIGDKTGDLRLLFYILPISWQGDDDGAGLRAHPALQEARHLVHRRRDQAQVGRLLQAVLGDDVEDQARLRGLQDQRLVARAPGLAQTTRNSQMYGKLGTANHATHECSKKERTTPGRARLHQKE